MRHFHLLPDIHPLEQLFPFPQKWGGGYLGLMLRVGKILWASIHSYNNFP